jgi:hypothetical protein
MYGTKLTADYINAAAFCTKTKLARRRAILVKMAPLMALLLLLLLLLQLAVAANSGALQAPPPAANYSVLLRHGSQADCPCFRIPCLVTTKDAADSATLVLLVEARWSSSECYPISGPKPPPLPPSPPALALISSTDAVRSVAGALPQCCCCQQAAAAAARLVLLLLPGCQAARLPHPPRCPNELLLRTRTDTVAWLFE